MGKYDTVLKIVLQRWGTAMFSEIITEPIASWHNVELPQFSTQYADVLGETSSGRLWHIELQSSNDPTMPLRMLEYAVRIYRKFNRVPGQAVLYVGRDPLRMPDGVAAEGLSFRYHFLNVSAMEADALLSSDSVCDNVMAVLTRVRSSPELIRRILERIAVLDNEEREIAFQALILLGTLRQSEETIEKEARNMPVFGDILNDKVLGREYKRGLDRGLEQGREQGELNLVRIMLKDRFAAIPPEVEAKLAVMTPAELERLAPRLLHAASLEELFG